MLAAVRVSVLFCFCFCFCFLFFIFSYFYLWFTIVNYGLFFNTAAFCGVPDCFAGASLFRA